MDKNVKFFIYFFVFPFLAWLLFTPWSATLDIAITRIFYENGQFSSSPYWDIIYDYGVIPGWILFFVSLYGFISSYFSSKYQTWRKPSLFILLTFAIGPGLIIHGILKEHWGRPRPKQVIEFGGSQSFRPYYYPHFNQPEPSKSFASGHSSMGFAFFSAALLGLRSKNKKIFWGGIAIAWILGILLSLARIAVGGHFLSDTLASALIMWWLASGLYYFLFHPLRRKS